MTLTPWAALDCRGQLWGSVSVRVCVCARVCVCVLGIQDVDNYISHHDLVLIILVLLVILRFFLPFFFFCIVSNFNILKTLTLLVHAGLFWCVHNPPNSDMDYSSLTCVGDLLHAYTPVGPQFIVSSKGLL